MEWDSLCGSKRDGGMGFRDLRSFNLGMFGKQVWRIIHFPNSLLSRIFKAKYFSHDDILNICAKSNSSFTWKSICSAIDLVKHGIRWRIGNGDSVDIWHDNWIPRDYLLKLITPDMYDLGSTSVSSLISNDAWDIDLLHMLFWEDDIDAILQIPVSQFDAVSD